MSLFFRFPLYGPIESSGLLVLQVFLGNPPVSHQKFVPDQGTITFLLVYESAETDTIFLFKSIV